MSLIEYLRETWAEGAPGKLVVLSAVALLGLIVAVAASVAVEAL